MNKRKKAKLRMAEKERIFDRLMKEAIEAGPPNILIVTDLAKARKFAEDYAGITNVTFENDQAEVMNIAQSFLALSEKVKKLELLRVAAMNSPCRHSSDVTSASCSVCDALKQLREHGEADE